MLEELAEGDTSAPTARRLVQIVALLAVAVALAVTFWKLGLPALDSTSESALARRAQLFWDLRLAGDTLGAYELMSETYRKRVTPAQFAREGGRVLRTGAKVSGVVLDDKGGLVEVKLSWRFNHPEFAELEHDGTAKERWVLEDGEWYRWPPGL